MNRKRSVKNPPARSDAPARWRGGKLWAFRVLASFGVPLVLLTLLELALRIGGYGHLTAFLLPGSRAGNPVLEPNRQFGWRFFGPELARLPHPFSIARPKPKDTIRIFVLGESAAKGDPDPNFGLARMLEATLALRHPGTRFEVINAAMTAINSHAVLPIARDCARAESDIWVVYMGNNEVVGPFGAGTVFGAQTPPLPLIRATLALRSARSGQLLESLVRGLQGTLAHKGEWGGMEMFLEQQVPAEDPRLQAVYHHFASNLADILRLAQRRGIGTVVSTVAVNLRDCAPFASAHRAGLSDAALVEWNAAFRLGVQEQEAGRMTAATKHFSAAARLDDRFAELRFRQGQCAMALEDHAAARTHFQAARDFDTLRFRCDTQLNGIIREVVTNHASQAVLLADAETVFASQSAGQLPGAEYFYEHVHLKFAGNWLLARTIAQQIEVLLGGRFGKPGDEPVAWPSRAECARRLGWSEWSQLAGWKGILPRLSRPPFTGQFDHAAQMSRVQSTLVALAGATQPAGLSNALTAGLAALEAAPNDPALLRQLAAIQKAQGDVSNAAVAVTRAVELLPNDADAWLELGLIQVQWRRFPEAVAALRRSVELSPRDVGSREALAQSLAAAGRRDEALREYQRVLDQRPQLGLAWLHCGQLHEQMGNVTEAAKCYAQARANPGQNLDGLIELAGFCQQRGWFDAAAELYVKALNAGPPNAQLHVGAGQNFAALKRLPEAGYHSAAAIRLAPDFAEAHLLHGLVLGRQGQLTAAAAAFREALRLKPELLDARLNLGIALAGQDPAAALEQFDAVIKVSPTNATALRYIQQLRGSRGGP